MNTLSFRKTAATVLVVGATAVGAFVAAGPASAATPSDAGATKIAMVSNRAGEVGKARPFGSETNHRVAKSVESALAESDSFTIPATGETGHIVASDGLCYRELDSFLPTKNENVASGVDLAPCGADASFDFRVDRDAGTIETASGHYVYELVETPVGYSTYGWAWSYKTPETLPNGQSAGSWVFQDAS